MKFLRVVGLGLLTLLAGVSGAAAYVGFPTTMAGMAAKTVCSGVFVAKRSAEAVIRDDFLPASAVLRFLTVHVNTSDANVTASLFGLASRTAQWSPTTGCVLDGKLETKRDGKSDVQSDIKTPVAASNLEAAKQSAANLPWPLGESLSTLENQTTTLPPANGAALAPVFTAAFAGGHGPGLQNTRALVVIQKGQLVREQYAPGFDKDTRLHGWSMTKTLGAMLALHLADAQNIALATPVVNLYSQQDAPPWLARWKNDARAQITLADLLHMRDGLSNVEGYQPWSDVPRLLWGGNDVASYAANGSYEAPAGTRWRYLSATSIIAAHAMSARAKRPAYNWVTEVITGPIGAHSFVVEPDAQGTPVLSSYGWATARDWGRLGLLLMNDGTWPDGQGGTKRVLPAGVYKQLTTPAMAEGEGAAYGMQLWLLGKPQSSCGPNAGLPEDTVVMGGHWGQVVAVIPSRQLIIVRLGWTMKKDLFDRCALIREVSQALK
jgi:CubicO group peptidase (beta-lactamase class C family)